MAFIILFSRGEEIGRRSLDGPLTLGRAPDCALPVRDVLMSRRHCRLEPAGGGWVVLDLRSRNGTWLEGQRVGRRGLRHGDELRVGKTTIRFMVGPLPPGRPRRPGGGVKSRPADPFEALSATVAGAVVEPDPADERPRPSLRPANRFPVPRPVPPDPESYARDGLYSMLSEIASSSWDSIYANASRPTRMAAKVVLPAGAAMAQAGADSSTSGATTATATVAAPAPRSPTAKPTVPQVERRRRQPPQAARAVRPHAQADSALVAVCRPARAVRPARPTLPIRLPEVPYRQADGLAARLWRGAGRVLTALRRRVVPPGSVVLF